MALLQCVGSQLSFALDKVWARGVVLLKQNPREKPQVKKKVSLYVSYINLKAEWHHLKREKCEPFPLGGV